MALNLVTARQGVLGQLAKIKETTIDVDPGSPTPYIVPLAAPETVAFTQAINPAVIGDGRRTSKGSFRGVIDDSGDVPVSLDFRFAGIDFQCHYGSDVYSRVGGRHRWNGFGTPISFQLEKRHTQATAIFHRHKAMYSTMVKFAPQAAGQAMYTVSCLGAGDEVRTHLAGTDFDYAPFTGMNYFNGQLLLQGSSLADIIGFNLSLENNITRKDAFFHAGAAASFNLGVPRVQGDLGRIFSVDTGDTFYDLAVNETLASMECVYTDLPIDSSPTQWLRFIIPAVRFSRKEAPIQLDQSEDQTQHFIAQIPATDYPAEMIALVPFNTGATMTVPAASHYYVKLDGGSVTDVDLSAIAGSKTLDQIITAINADSGFNVKGIASNFLGRLRVKSLSTVAATSKVQNQAGTGNINALVGTTDVSTIWAGFAAKECITELFNTVTADY